MDENYNQRLYELEKRRMEEFEKMIYRSLKEEKEKKDLSQKRENRFGQIDFFNHDFGRER